MITLSEEKPCIDSDVIKDLHETYDALQNEPKNTLENRLQYYVDRQYEFDSELRKDCPVEIEEAENSVVSEEVSTEE